MFCGCELTFGEPPNTHTCPVCLGPARGAAGGQRRGDPLRPDDRPGARLASSRRARSSTARTTSIPTCQGLPDQPVRRTAVPRRAARRRAHPPRAPRGGRGEARPRRRERAHPRLRRRRSSTSTAAARRWSRSSPSPTCARPSRRASGCSLLRATLRQLGVSDVNMEEGSLRCDANVSIRPAGSDELGTKTELKNMNSFRFIERGIDAEIARQTALLERGRAGRAGDAALRPAHRRDHVAALQGGGARLPLLPRARPRRRSRSPRRCSSAARAAMPELPAARAERYERELGLDADERAPAAPSAPSSATTSRPRSPRATAPTPQRVANWVDGELVARDRATSDPAAVEGRARGARHARRAASPTRRSPPARAKQVLDKLVAEGGDPRGDRRGRGPRRDRRRRRARRRSCAAALAANPDAAEKLRGGNMKAIGADRRPRDEGDARAAPTAGRSRPRALGARALAPPRRPGNDEGPGQNPGPSGHFVVRYGQKPSAAAITPASAA